MNPQRVNHYVIEASLSRDAEGLDPLPPRIGPFFTRPAADRWLESQGALHGDWTVVPVTAPYDAAVA